MEPKSHLSIVRHEKSPKDFHNTRRNQIMILGEANAWLTGWVRDCVQHSPVCHAQQIESQLVTADEVLATLTSDREMAPTVLLTQERPGQLPRSLPSQISDVAPGARLLSVAGSWCEGELRTGAPHEEVERIYWHQLPTWLETISEDQANEPSKRHVVYVDATHRESAAAIIDTLQAAGHAAVWMPRQHSRPLATGYTAAVWVGGQLNGAAAAVLADCCHTMRETGAPVIALLDFPRHDELKLAQQVGASAVLGMPWSAEDLLMTLDRVTGDALSNVHFQRRKAA